MAEPVASAHLDPVHNGAAHHSAAAPTFQRQAVEAAQDIAFGSIAGIAGKIIEYPFDTVKVRLQAQPATRPLRYAGPLDCFRQGWRAGGLRDLYRGVSAPMVGAAVETGSLFLSYRLVQLGARRLLDDTSDLKGDGDGDRERPLPVPALAACGAAAGGVTSLLLTPIELVKCQMQAPPGGGAPPRSPLAVIAGVLRHHGPRGFWRGQLGTLIRETGGSTAWFGAYEGVCAFFKRRQQKQQQREGQADAPAAAEVAAANVAANAALPLWQQLLAGAAAGVGYNFLFFPADTIKSRMQTEAVEPATGGGVGGRRPGFMAVGAALWRQRGLRGMYQGCGITVARSAPSSAFIFAIYEGLKASFA